jgi:hypothetical protein
MSKEDTDTQVDLKTLLEGMSNLNNEKEDGEYPPSTSIELTHEIVEAMFDETKLKMITDLTELEIKGLLKLHVLNEIIFDGRSSVISKLSNEIMLLKISKNRGGRREMIKAIFSNSGEMMDEGVSRFKRFIS